MGTRVLNWKNLGRVLTSFSAALLLFLSSANADLGPADEVLVRAGGIRALLKSPAVQKEYYEKLAEHFGGARKFSTSSYTAILSQLAAMLEKQPELEARLWETTGTGNAFSLTSAIEDFGLTLKKKEFAKFLGRALGELDEKAGTLAGLEGEALGSELEKRWGAIRTTTQEKIKSIDLDAAISKNEKGLRKAAIFREMSARPELEESSAALLAHYYAREDVRAILTGADPNLILDFFRDLRDQPGRILAAAGLSADRIPGVSGKLKTLIPDYSELLKNPLLFKERVKKVRSGEFVAVGKTASGVYEFKPIPRRVHGIFKGVVLGECVGGNCNNLGSLTPERWATAALTDTQIYQIERGNSYLGFVQIVPIRNNSTGEIVGSVDFGSSVFDGGLYLENKETKLTSRQKVFQAWLENAYATKPASWRGFVVGESNAINNAGMLEMVHGSTEYQAGELLGSSKNYSHLDEFATNLIAASKKVAGSKSHYGGRMVFDGMTPNAGRLHEIRPSDPAFHERAFLAEFGEADFKTASTWERFLKSKNVRNMFGFAIDRAGVSVLELPGVFTGLYKVAYDSRLQHLDPNWTTALNNKFAATIFSKDAPDDTKRIARKFLAGRIFDPNYGSEIWADRSPNFSRDLGQVLTVSFLGDWFRAVRIRDETVDAAVSAYFKNLPASFRGDERRILQDRMFRLDSVEAIEPKSFLKLMKWVFTPDQRSNPGITSFRLDPVLKTRADGSERFAAIVKKYHLAYGEEFGAALYEILAPAYFSDFEDTAGLSRRLYGSERGITLRYQMEAILRIAPESERTKIYAAAYRIIESFPDSAPYFPDLTLLYERYPPRTVRSTTGIKNAIARMEKLLARFKKSNSSGEYVANHYFDKRAIQEALPALKAQIKFLDRLRCRSVLVKK